MLETDRTLDLKVIPLPQGSLHAKTNEANTQLRQIKDVGVNLAMLPIQTLHVLHQGVSNELRIREQRALPVISEVKMNNEQIFAKKPRH